MERDPIQLVYLLCMLGVLVALYFFRRKPPTD